MLSTSPELPSPAAMAQDLTNFIALQGRLILEDRARLLLKLREAMPGRTRAINLLMTAVDTGAVQNLSGSGPPSDPLAMEQMAQSITDSTGTQIALARWAVDAWQKTLVPAVRSPAIAAAPPPPAEDLIWDDESAAPATAPAVQMRAPPLLTTATPAAATVVAPTPAKKPSILKWAALAAVLVAVAAGGLYAAGLLQLPGQFPWNDDEPEAKKPVTRSTQVLVAPGRPITAAQVKEAETDIIIDGMSNKKEPTFPSVYEANATQEHWQFEFNVRYSNGKRVAYQVNLIGRNDTGPSQGIIWAIDRSLADDKMLSVSNPLKIVNEPNKLTNGHFAWGFTWAKNPSGVPAVCVQLYTSPEKPGEHRYPAFFFVQAFSDDSCSSNLGSGELQ